MSAVELQVFVVLPHGALFKFHEVAREFMDDGLPKNMLIEYFVTLCPTFIQSCLDFFDP